MSFSQQPPEGLPQGAIPQAPAQAPGPTYGNPGPGDPPPPPQVETQNLFTPSEESKEIAPSRELKQRIFESARTRFGRAKTFEHNARQFARDDLRFADGDAYNGYQWPQNIRRNRERDQKPCLTLNRTRQHNLLIINDAKQNKPGISIRPTGNEATYEAAVALECIVRHIEYQSRASVAYDVATNFQVKAGYGVIRVDADYISNDTFDQDIFIRTMRRPDLVYFDPDAKEVDRSDAKWAFVFDEVSREDFNDIYPEYAGQIQVFDEPQEDWITKERVRVAEYFYIELHEDWLIQFKDHDGIKKTIKASLLGEEFRQQLLDDPSTRKRKIKVPTIKWALIVGTNVADTAVIPCDFIPLVPVIGEETFIDGQYDRKGHTRSMLDAQRMYNYWSSQAVEQVALQSKTPWVAAADAIEGHEVYWNTANVTNYSILTWNHIDDDGNPIPPPFRQDPPQMAPAYLSGMEVTQREMMMVSGQFQAQMGEPSNERSATSIQQRQRQGDVATYHYIDNLAIAIRQVGRIVLSYIPRIYTEERVLQAQGEDGVSFEVEINPQEQQAFKQHLDHDGKVAKRVLNPQIGRYDVEADIGPSFGTKREQAADTLIQIITQAPQLTTVIGDLLLRNLDSPNMDEAAERLKRAVPPALLGQGPTQNEQALQAQLTQIQSLCKKLWDQLVEAKSKHMTTEAMRDIDAYEAETKRIAALAKIFPDADATGLHKIITQLVNDAMKTDLTPVVDAIKGQLGPVDETGGISLGTGQTPGGTGNSPGPLPQPAEFMNIGGGQPPQ